MSIDNKAIGAIKEEIAKPIRDQMKTSEVQIQIDRIIQDKKTSPEDERPEELQGHSVQAASLITHTRRSKRLEEKRGGHQY